MAQSWTTRFAPSPTGLLHRGHAYSALLAERLARQSGGRFLLRIEDIDSTRCRPEFAARILEDLDWLGLAWSGPVRRQSEHLDVYRRAIDSLLARRLLYPCFCSRQEIADEVARMQSAPQGPEGPLYPGTCRHLDDNQRARRIALGALPALRLDVAAGMASLGGWPLQFLETGQGPAGEAGTISVQPNLLGDVVLARRDIGVSYHLAVVLDDDAQGVTLVTRGEDLFAATHVQRLIQGLLGLRRPAYHHHRLLRDASGRRLSKRDQDETLAELRARGVRPAALRAELSQP
jgi:glutamyl-Q tRNA(Asp) synthetase